jgi:hypothetical protein
VKPVQHLSEAIFRKKYGDEKLQQRIKYRGASGWPLWSPAGKQGPAE